ncbi:MAG: glycosyltransferase family 4 protein [Acidimicrobiia bacterium]|nr:glycosyltransferase family 4 protein [Acidimicrobiia bacterium]
MTDAQPHVVFVVENESVPSDRRVWLEACALRDAGARVTVVGPIGERRDHERSVTIDGIAVRRFPLRFATGGLASYAWEYGSALARIGWELARLARRCRIDVVHVANPPDVLFLPVVPLKVLAGTKLVFDHHDMVPELFETRFGRRGAAHAAVRLAERATYRMADLVVATNESYRSAALERGGKRPDQVVVVRNAPDLDRFERVAADPALRGDRRHLAVYVGVIGPQDGVDHALRAVHHYRNVLGRDDLRVAVVGAGDALADNRRLAVELGVDDVVDFVGWQDLDGVLRYLSSADVALAPDPRSPLNDRSTMIKMVEYLALGVPTVSFDLPESRVTAGDAAVFVPGNDVGAFATAVAELLDDPARRARLAEAGRARSRGELAWARASANLVEGYRRIVELPDTP